MQDHATGKDTVFLPHQKFPIVKIIGEGESFEVQNRRRLRSNVSRLRSAAPTVIVGTIIAAALAPAVVAPVVSASALAAMLGELYKLTLQEAGKDQLSKLVERAVERVRRQDAEQEAALSEEIQAALVHPDQNPELLDVLGQLISNDEIIMGALAEAPSESREDLADAIGEVAGQLGYHAQAIDALQRAVNATGSELREANRLIQERQEDQIVLLLDEQAQAERRHLELVRRIDRIGMADSPPPQIANLLGPAGQQISANISSPYVGLRPFDEDDAELFFGRDQLVAALISRVGREPLWVIGASGTGKSSAVRAGMVPVFRRDKRCLDVQVVRPSAYPVESLRSVLQQWSGIEDGAERLLETPDDEMATELDRLLRSDGPEGRFRLLVVDQCEEMFRLGAPPDEINRFAKLLAAAGRSRYVRVVAVLRSDFYDDVSRFDFLRDGLERNQVIVHPLSDTELTEAIVGPAEAVGCSVDPLLLETALDDVHERPGALPLLAHALAESWHGLEGRTLPVEAYLGVGRLSASLEMTAERVYEIELDDDGRKGAQLLMMRLTDYRENGAAMSRPLATRELEALPNAAAIRTAADRFAESRLITVSNTEIRVSHETLFTVWGTYQRWLEAEKETLHAVRHLRLSTSEWERRGRSEEALYQDQRLSGASNLVNEQPDLVGEAERSFVAAGQALEESEAKLERRSRRRQQLVGVGAVVLVGLASVSLLAFANARREADQERELSQINALTNEAQAWISGDPDRALAAALEASSRSGEPGADEVLAATLAARPVAVERFGPADAPIRTLASGINGEVVYAVDVAGRVTSLTPGGREELFQLPWSQQSFAEIVPESGRVILFDGQSLSAFALDTGRALSPEPISLPALATKAVVSEDGSRLLIGYADGTVQSMRLGDLAVEASGKVSDFQVTALGFGRSSSEIFVGGLNSFQVGSILSFDIVTGETIERLGGQVASPTAVALDPSDGHLIVGWSDGRLSATNLGLGSSQPVTIFGGAVGSIKYDRDGGRMIVWSTGLVSVVNAATSATEFTLPAVTSTADGIPGQGLAWVSIDDRNNRVLISTSDHAALAWDLDNRQGLAERLGALASYPGATIDPTSGEIAALGQNGTIDLIAGGPGDRATNRVTVEVGSSLVAPLMLSDDSLTVTFRGTPTGSDVIGLLGVARVDLVTGQTMFSTEPRWRDGQGFATDDLMVFWSIDEPAKPQFWNLREDRADGPEFEPAPALLSGLTMSQDRRRLLGADVEGVLHEWSITTGKILSSSPRVHGGAITALLIAADGRLWSGGADGTIVATDPDTWTSETLYSADDAIISFAQYEATLAVLEAGGRLVTLKTEVSGSATVLAVLAPISGASRIAFGAQGAELRIVSAPGPILAIPVAPERLQLMACERLDGSSVEESRC